MCMFCSLQMDVLKMLFTTLSRRRYIKDQNRNYENVLCPEVHKSKNPLTTSPLRVSHNS